MSPLLPFWRRLSLLGGVAVLLSLVSSCTPDAPESCPEGHVLTEQGCAQPAPPNGEGPVGEGPVGDDHGDTPATATRVGPRGGGAGVFDRPQDVDVFAFPVVAGHLYRFGCDAPFLHYDRTCVVRLLSANGEKLEARGVFWRLGFKAAAEGLAYAEVRSTSLVFPHAFSYGLEDLGPADDNDTPETATPLSPGMEDVRAQIELAGDVDFFAFTGEAGHIYQFDCRPSAGTESCELQLSDGSGRVLSKGEIGLGYKVTAAGRYTIRLQFIRNHFDATLAGPYSYSFLDRGLDDHGDLLEDATQTALGGTVGGRIDYAGDRDVFRFTLPAKHIVRVGCDSGGAPARMSLRLKDSSGQVLEQREGTVTYEAGDVLAPLFVEFVAVDATPMAYSCRVEDLGLDDHADSPEGAAALTASGQSGWIESRHDTDFFRVEATTGHFYRIRCTASGMSCRLRVWVPGGPVPETQYDTVEVKAAGPFFVEVLDYYTRGGRYTLSLEDAGADDHGDTRDTATRVLLDALTPGRLEVDSDVDVFLVTLEKNRRYEITTWPSDMNLYVWGPFGRLYFNGNPSPAVVVLSTEDAGEHRLEVRRPREGVNRSYQLRVREL